MMGANVVIRAAHSSGKWDGSSQPFWDDVKRLRGHHSVVSRTEVADKFAEGHHRDDSDGWSYWRPHDADCSIEWDSKLWRVLDLGVLPLTSIRIHTAKGFLKAPCSATLASLQLMDSSLRVTWSTAHLDLENTPLRRQAAHQERVALARHWRNALHRTPDVHQVFQGDINLDQRQRHDRELTGQMVPPGMVNLWAGHLPADGGTHGHAVLDVALTSLPGRVQLLRDDPSSDHRPIGVELETRVPAGAS